MSQAAIRKPELVRIEGMMDSAKSASRFLKALSNETRLRLLCQLADSEKSVSELEAALGLRQPAISQQLARLRADELVTCRRAGKTIHYSLASDEARRVIAVLCEVFWRPDQRLPAAPLAAVAAGE